MSGAALRPDFEALPRVVPIFPLPGVLLLPGGKLPLNIFEPRYLAMVRDALAGERAIAMIQPREDAAEVGAKDVSAKDVSAKDVGTAEVYETGCLGRITAYSETDDGRYLITLTGLIRFDVARELPPMEGYRRVTADYERFRGDIADDPGAADSAIDRTRFLETLGFYFEAQGIEGDWKAIEKTGDAVLVTSLAMLCPFAASEKQALLEAVGLAERARAMTAIMEMSVHEPGGAGPAH
jgi:Lon protease-like protein